MKSVLAKMIVNVFLTPRTPIANMALLYHLGMNQE